MKMWLRVLLVILSAVLATLVFAPVSWSWLAVVAWIPLFAALRGVSPRAGAWLGFGHGVIFYGCTMTWIADVFGAWSMHPPLVVVMSLFTLFFGIGVSLGFKRYGASWIFAVFTGSWWIVTEFIRSEIYALQFPWMTPGVGLGPSLLSPVFGVYGMSLLIVIGGMLLLNAGKQRVVGGALLVLALLAATLRPDAELGDDQVKVMAVQIEEVLAGKLLDMVDENSAEVDVVVFPEYAISYDLRQSTKTWPKWQEFAEKRDLVGVVGTQTNSGNSYFNTALTFDGSGTLGEHYKNHTVHFFNDGIKGTTADAVSTPKGKFGTPICFDCDYEDVIRKMTQSGAEYFIIPSLDATRWGRKQHLQHAELFRHRAAENGRWMMVASGSGMTQLIDSYGNRVEQLELMTEGTLVGTLSRTSELTFFTRCGWLLPWVVMICGLIWMSWVILSLFLDRKKRA